MSGSAEEIQKSPGPPVAAGEGKGGPSEEERLRGRLLYLQADFENLQKRLAREREEMRKFAVEGLVLQLVDVKENLELALRSAPPEGAFREGVEMIHRQMDSLLRAQGLAEIAAVGQRFDPFLHEALEQVDVPGTPGMVVEEVRRGYRLHNKVLRASMVKVAR